MPHRQRNQIGRFIAVLALLAAFTVVVWVVVSNENSKHAGGKGAGPDKSSPEVERALQRGVYVVKPGDTLVGISAKLGIDVNDMLEINPDLDPQILSAGQRIRLPQ